MEVVKVLLNQRHKKTTDVTLCFSKKNNEHIFNAYYPLYFFLDLCHYISHCKENELTISL